MESTNPNNLGSVGGLILGQKLTVDNQNGVIEAHGTNTHVNLDRATIVGGTLETSGTNAVIETVNGQTYLDGTQSGNPVNVAGHVLVVDNTDLSLMGTINNTGVITVASGNPINGGNSTRLIINGDVTLEGGGHVTLGDNANNSIQANPVLPSYESQLTNVDNVISGAGSLSVAIVNQANGIIDANDSTPLILEGVTGAGPDTNAGLIEATNHGTLLIQSAIDNYLNTTLGTVEAGNGSIVGLENATIAGGFVTAAKGAIIEAEVAASTITGAVVTNAGTVGAEGANLTIIGDVTNTGTLDANNATLVIDGAVSGGKATLEGTGQIEFGGASSAKVTFAANSDAILKLDHQSVGDPSAFTGTVSGLNTGGFIDLTNINFADNPTLSYSSKTHVLTVTDNVSHVTDTIKFVGVVGSFSAQSDGSGGTFISDPPPAATNMVTVSHDQFVFASPLGENGGKATNANVQHNEPIDFPHQGGEFVDLAALMAQAHAEGAHLMAAPDAIDMHHAAALAAHHFSV